MNNRSRTLAGSLGVFTLAVLLEACATTGVGVQAGNSVEPEVTRPAGRSVSDGVFTRGQAFRGERRFQQVCAACHRPVEITSIWFRAAVYETVGDMYRQISLTMPESDPGGLSAEEYTDIIAFILRAKEYPAGEQELPPDAALLENVSLSAQ